MCTTCVEIKTNGQAFGDRLVEIMNGGAVTLMLSIGHRTGLFDTMAGAGWLSSQDLARKASLSERYVREWLGALTTARITEHDPENQTYRLPEAHAAFLTRSATPNNAAASMQWFSVLGKVEDLVVDAFRHGRGVPYSAYDRFHEVMAEESAQTVIGGLDQHIIPLVEGLEQKLTKGIEVLDVGCGAGRALIYLAGKYPNSRFTGVDFSDQAIGLARADVKRRGLRNITFEVQDAAKLSYRDKFDLVFTFDAVHDQADPAKVLSNIHRALKSGGTYLMQDIKAETPVHENADNPLAPFIYTISTMHCMSVSLANNGLGLGAAWGKQKALDMLRDAGFGEVRVQELEHDPLNYYYTMRK